MFRSEPFEKNLREHVDVDRRQEYKYVFIVTTLCAHLARHTNVLTKSKGARVTTIRPKISCKKNNRPPSIRFPVRVFYLFISFPRARNAASPGGVCDLPRFRKARNSCFGFHSPCGSLPQRTHTCVHKVHLSRRVRRSTRTKGFRGRVSPNEIAHGTCRARRQRRPAGPVRRRRGPHRNRVDVKRESARTKKKQRFR